MLTGVDPGEILDVAQERPTFILSPISLLPFLCKSFGKPFSL